MLALDDGLKRYLPLKEAVDEKWEYDEDAALYKKLLVDGEPVRFLLSGHLCILR